MKDIDILLKENNLSRTKISNEHKIITNYCIKFLDGVNNHIIFKRFIAFFLAKIGVQPGIIALTCKYTPKKTKEIRKINKLYETGGPYKILPGSHTGRKKKITPEIHTLLVKLILKNKILSSRKLAAILMEKYNIDISYKVIEKEINTYKLKSLIHI